VTAKERANLPSFASPGVRQTDIVAGSRDTVDAGAAPNRQEGVDADDRVPEVKAMHAKERKAFSREYKNTHRTMGIGLVRNAANGRVLLLAGQDISALLNRHRTELRFGSHRNVALQRDWNAAGEQVFTFEVVDTLTPRDTPGYDPADDLRALELLWLEKLEPFEPVGYNPAPRS
jgi:hypothetical protein